MNWLCYWIVMLAPSRFKPGGWIFERALRHYLLRKSEGLE